jgi:hypothetical protein
MLEREGENYNYVSLLPLFGHYCNYFVTITITGHNYWSQLQLHDCHMSSVVYIHIFRKNVGGVETGLGKFQCYSLEPNMLSQNVSVYTWEINCSPQHLLFVCHQLLLCKTLSIISYSYL